MHYLYLYKNVSLKFKRSAKHEKYTQIFDFTSCFLRYVSGLFIYYTLNHRKILNYPNLWFLEQTVTEKARVDTYKSFISQNVNYVSFNCVDTCMEFRTS